MLPSLEFAPDRFHDRRGIVRQSFASRPTDNPLVSAQRDIRLFPPSHRPLEIFVVLSLNLPFETQ